MMLDVFVLCRSALVAGTLLVKLAVRHVRSKRRSTFDATGITIIWHLGGADDIARSSLYFHYVLGARSIIKGTCRVSCGTWMLVSRGIKGCWNISACNRFEDRVQEILTWK